MSVKTIRVNPPQTQDWAAFPGGELEGRRPRALCPVCREALEKALGGGPPAVGPSPTSRTLCFACYRAELDRERRLKAAGQIDTATDARFQSALPFEPVNRARLEMLRASRTASRAASQSGVARFADRRRQAQIAARHALQRLAAGLRDRGLTAPARERELAAAIRGAELQLPESWLPFVVSQ